MKISNWGANLINLIKRDYRGVRLTSLWEKTSIDLNNFRGDNDFLYQTRYYGEAAYRSGFLAALSQDALGVISSSPETNDYGAECFQIEGRWVSRDIIDSTIELNFLNNHVDLNQFASINVLDIGCGYGRLGRRILDTLQNVSYFGVDVTFQALEASRIYLERHIESKRAFIFDQKEIEATTNVFDIAINIHSFSEMTPDYVQFWLNFAYERQVEYLFVVPNNNRLATNRGTKLMPIFLRSGFAPFVESRKYLDEQHNRTAIYPDTYYIFKRNREKSR